MSINRYFVADVNLKASLSEVEAKYVRIVVDERDYAALQAQLAAAESELEKARLQPKCGLQHVVIMAGRIVAKFQHAEARVKWLEEGKRIIELARDGVVFRQASIDEWLAAEPKAQP